MLLNFACNNDTAKRMEEAKQREKDSIEKASRLADSLNAIAEQIEDFDEEEVSSILIAPKVTPFKYNSDTVKYLGGIYIIEPGGTKVVKGVSWCFNYGEKVIIKSDNDTLLGVVLNYDRIEPYPTVYIQKLHTGLETELQLDNF